MKYRFIADSQQEYPVSTLCRVFEVSVSGYYAWKQRATSHRQWEDEMLAKHIGQVHHASQQVYRSRRIRAELAYGRPLSYKIRFFEKAVLMS
jgi:putative transposase